MAYDPNKLDNAPTDKGGDRKEESMVGLLWTAIKRAFKSLENWLTPDKNQPVALQIVFFVIKIPVLLLLLLLSPVLLVILLLISLIAL